MFANDIAEALRAARMLVVPPFSVISGRMVGTFGDPLRPPVTGVFVTASNDSGGLELADSLVRELTARGFDAVRQTDPPPDKNIREHIWVDVESRPEGPQGEYKLQAEAEKKKTKNKTPANH